MICKLILFLILFVQIQLVLTKSFTIVLDTTVSMREEVDVLRRNLPSVGNILKNASEFEEFIVVPFNDPDVGTPIFSRSAENLVESLNGLAISGGHDCPEDSLSGIQKALEVSKPESLIYVFTDAFSKDDGKFHRIEDLCKSTRSQVVIFLSGSCFGYGSRPTGSIDVYYDLTKACSGLLFRFDVISLRKAFKYMQEMVASDWNDITSYEPFTGYKQFTFSADSFTKDILLAVSGDYPSLQIVDPEGKSPEIHKVVDARQALVVRVSNFKSGAYQVSIRCQSLTSLTVYKMNKIPFEYGFSTRVPRSLKETSSRPMPGWLNYILIVLPPSYNIQISSIELQMKDGISKQSLLLEESQNKLGFYVTSVFVEPDKSFKCVIHGRDTVTYEEITYSTKLVDVQKSVPNTSWTKPTVEMIKTDDMAEFGKDYTLACKVKGYPRPEIIWEYDLNSAIDGSTEEILLEMPSTYINYITINATENSTICCKASNTQGDDSQCTEYFVNRTFTFDVIESPKDETFEFETEGKLFCKVDAYPEAEYKWYHNDTSVENSDNIQVVVEEFALVIKNMSLDDIGSYQCVVANAVKNETFTAEVTISGLDAPEIDLESTDVNLTPGEYKTIECRVSKGNPTPEITWKYQNTDSYDFSDEVPSGVYVEEGELKIPAATIDVKGMYKCVASNIMGEDYRDITVKIQYAPKITNSDEGTLVVMEGDAVELTCEVDAIPKATVRWEVTQDDVIVSLDERHTTNERNTHRFYALWKDSGNYHCIAENEKGKTEKTVTVNVQVAPFIQPPESRIVEVKAGSSISIPCNVLYGNPVPSTKWEFIAPDSTITVLSRGKTMRVPLNLRNISKANEGMYRCVADNEVGNDRIRISLRLK